MSIPVMPFGERIDASLVNPLPRTPAVIVPGHDRTERNIATLIPTSPDRVTNSIPADFVSLLAEHRQNSGGSANPPYRGPFTGCPGPGHLESFYLSFRYVDFAQDESLGNCWGVFLKTPEVWQIAVTGLEYGLSPADACNAAVSMLTNMLTARFLVDRAVLSLESIELMHGRPAHLWKNYAPTRGNDLESAVCLAFAHRSARGRSRSFQRALLRGVHQLNFVVNFGDGTINGEHHSLAESINLTNYLSRFCGTAEIPGLHRLMGLREATGTHPVTSLEIARGRSVQLPVRFVS